MKKLKAILFANILVLSIFLSGCITFTNHFERYEKIENISSIDIYYIDEYELTDIPSSLSSIKTIDEENYQESIEKLEELEFKDTIIVIAANDPNFHIFKFVIKITYQSGAYQIVSNIGSIYTYNQDGFISCIHGACEEEKWNEILISYIGQELFDHYN